MIAQRLKLNPKHVEVLLKLSERGNSPSFLSRYKRDDVGFVDEMTILKILKIHREANVFEDKRRSVLKTLQEKNIFDDSRLVSLAKLARTRAELTDITLCLQPYKSSKAIAAEARGLKPLADILLQQQPLTKSLEALASDSITPESGFTSPDEVLDGVRAILTEDIARDPRVRHEARRIFNRTARLKIQAALKSTELRPSSVDAWISGPAPTEASEDDPSKSSTKTPKEQKRESSVPGVFREFVGHEEPIDLLIGHRYFLIHKGERQKILTTEVEVDDVEIFKAITRCAIKTDDAAVKVQIESVLAEVYQHLIKPSFVAEIKQRLREKSQDAILSQLAKHYYHLLMQSPFGARPVCAVAATSNDVCVATALGTDGNVLDTTLILLAPDKEAEARELFISWQNKYHLQAFAVLDNDFSNKIFSFLKGIFSTEQKSVVERVMAPEAKLFATSDVAKAELGAFDENTRMSVYAGRKFMDPLVALASIDPLKLALGVHQRDVDQQQLLSRLNKVIEAVVGRVGVDINTASAALLCHVSGLNGPLAQLIVEHRTAHGPFNTREDLMQVKGIDGKIFEQAAGFVFVKNGVSPLDRLFIHPAHYALVAKMAESLSVPLADFLSDVQHVRKITPLSFVSDDAGVEAVTGILNELKTPVGDPRPKYETLTFDPNIKTVEDVKPGQILKGRVTSLADYGAFVDIGLERNALLHRSQMPERLSSSVSHGLQLGQIITVRVVGIEREKGRMRLAWDDGGPQKEYRSQESGDRKSDRSDLQHRPDKRPDHRDSRGPRDPRDRRDQPRSNFGPPRRGPDRRDNRDRPPKRNELGTLGDQFKALFQNQK